MHEITQHGLKSLQGYNSGKLLNLAFCLGEMKTLKHVNGKIMQLLDIRYKSQYFVN